MWFLNQQNFQETMPGDDRVKDVDFIAQSVE